MTPETQSIARAIHEQSAEALASGYDALRYSLAIATGKILIDAALPQVKPSVDRSERERIRQEKENAGFILESAALLPPVNGVKLPKSTRENPWQQAALQTQLSDNQSSETGRNSVRLHISNAFNLPNNPENYLALHGLIDRTLWSSTSIKTNYHPRFKYLEPTFVIGTNPNLGIVTYRPNNETSHNRLHKLGGWRGKRLARHYEIALKNTDPTDVKRFYHQKSDSFLIHGYYDKAKVVDRSKFTNITGGIPDHDIHNYNVLAHLMNLSALFDVEDKYAEVLEKYTKDAPAQEIKLLKGILSVDRSY